MTFCIWRSFAETRWTHNAIALPSGDDPDGSAELLSRLDGDPETYSRWAENCYECDVKLDAVKAIYERNRLTADLVTALNSELQINQLGEDIREIGYPT